jgi:hypothetical protein
MESLGYHYGDITWTCSGVPRPSVGRVAIVDYAS